MTGTAQSALGCARRRRHIRGSVGRRPIPPNRRGRLRSHGVGQIVGLAL